MRLPAELDQPSPYLIDWTKERYPNRFKTASPRKFLDAEEAAELLGGLNSRTVTRWAREGYLPSYPLGEGKRRLWRFLEKDLVLWMLARRTGQNSYEVEPPGNTLRAATDAPTRRFLEG